MVCCPIVYYTLVYLLTVEKWQQARLTSEKMADSIHPIVLCGGSGTRLWPLSRADFSKQFVPIADGRSLIDMTLSRLGTFGQPLMLVASDTCRFLALNALRQSGLTGRLLLEEEPKSTATAMVLAALSGYQSDDVLLFTPSDHLIPDHTAFDMILNP